MTELIKRLCRLLCVKSIVTLTLTAVFALLSVRGAVSRELMSIYTMIVGFYFGTQTVKREDSGSGPDGVATGQKQANAAGVSGILAAQPRSRADESRQSERDKKGGTAT